jgi:signal transduction histidine kinase
MTTTFYYLLLLNAIFGLAAAVTVFWKNRQAVVGPLFGVSMLVFALWTTGFAHYFKEMPDQPALLWGYVTLSASIAMHALLFHTATVLSEQIRSLRWWVVTSYALGAILLALLWSGYLVEGLRRATETSYLAHYIRYDRAWYPLLVAYLLSSQGIGIGILAYGAKKTSGYKRSQLIYFLVAWAIVFLTTTSVIVLIEYNIFIPPFGLFLLPLNMLFLVYVMAKARLADFNTVVARLLLYSVALLVVVVFTLLFLGGVSLMAPSFLSLQQMLFCTMLTSIIGITLAVTLPQWMPRAEQLMQSRLFGEGLGYREKLAGMANELSALPSEDQILSTVAHNIHTHMQLTRALVLLENPLSGLFQLQAESGLKSDESTDGLSLAEKSAIIQFLLQRHDALVRNELPRLVGGQAQRAIESELDQLHVAVCIPMLLDEKLMGLFCLGPKLDNEMFYVSDLRLLQNLATETALALKYRRMEEQVLRKNKLIELGTVAAGVAHEIRNPLASIRTFAQLLPTQMDDPEFKNEFSQLVLKDVDRITKVIESMLAFARPGQVTIAEHPAAELVEEAVLLLQSRLKNKRIELTRQFHEQPTLRVDRQQILQVLVNLISNACDALPEHGRIRVAIGTRFMESPGDSEVRQKFAVIEVADNGPGIPAGVRSRLFDPFFTTKKEGTGLGLSISQKICRDHGGVITVASVEGKGASFQINLPLIPTH